MSKIHIKEQSSNHKYFSIIPNIVFEIGLKANEISVYCAIKRSAGESSVCTKSKAKLAKQAGVCPKTIFTIIQKLSQVNKILKKPLISFKNRFTEDGDRDTNLIEVIDIWPENMNYFQEIIGEVNVTPPRVNITPPEVTLTQGGVRYGLPEGQVTVTHKEEPIKKNKQQHCEIAVVFSSLNCFDEIDISQKEKERICKKYTEIQVSEAVSIVSDKNFIPEKTLLKSLNAALLHGWKLSEISPKEKSSWIKINKESLAGYPNVFKIHKEKIVFNCRAELSLVLENKEFTNKFKKLLSKNLSSEG